MESLFSCLNEEVSKIEGKVKGTIPTWVCGSLYRNGPMMTRVGETELQHLFDGMAGVQQWSIKDGKVTYQRKFVQSNSYKKSLDANRLVVTQFGTVAYPDPCKNIFQRFFAYFKPESQGTDNTLVTVWPQRDRVFVSTETETIHEIDPETLETTNSVKLSDYLTINSATAHCHWDPDGTVHGFGYFYKGRNPRYTIYTIPPESEEAFSKVKIVGTIPLRWPLHPCYVHSFSVTENYYVFPEQTVSLSIPVLATLKWTGKTPVDAFKWYPNEKTVFHIMDKKTGDKINPEITYYTDPQFTFHHINAYEDNGFVVMDITAYKNMDIIKNLYMKNILEEIKKTPMFAGTNSVRRFVFPLHVDHNTPLNENLVTLPGCKAEAVMTEKNKIYCKYEVLYDETVFELPQINYAKYNGKKYKFAYAEGGLFTELVKLDIETRETSRWKEEGCSVSEPVFIPNPEGQDEDDGVILSAVTTYVENKKPFLLVLDGKTFKEKARVEFDIERFNLDFHGFFQQK